MSSSYRPDIDGLRAIAVLAVIIFHIDPTVLPGGFVGVDIFFVISGYLITFGVLKEINRGKFSITDFYVRRIKRILPVMYAVVATVLFVTQFFFLPEDAQRSGMASLWSLMSAANIYFSNHLDLGYFAASSDERPLLHLWSLGVEEQFYLIWPLVLSLLYKSKLGRCLPLTLIVLTISSFIFAEHYSSIDRVYTYFMLPTRAGELLIGASVAYAIFKQYTVKSRLIILEIFSFLGIILLSLSLVFLNKESVFPGYNAFAPTLGTAFLIYSGNMTKINKILSLRILVGIGLMSYSAYMWHWPVLAFTRYANFDMKMMSTSVSIISIIFIFSTLSYYLIEKPIRNLKKSAIWVLVNLFLAPTTLLILLCLIAIHLEGYGLRNLNGEYLTKIKAVISNTKPAYSYQYICQKKLLSPQDIVNPECILGTRNSKNIDVLLWGDSNASHYVGMLGVFAGEAGFAFRNFTTSSCPPVFADVTDYSHKSRTDDCRNSSKRVKESVTNARVLLLASSWIDYHDRSPKFYKDLFREVMERAQKGQLIILLGKLPVFETYDRLCWTKKISLPIVDCFDEPQEIQKDIQLFNQTLKTFALKTSNVEYFDPNEYLCYDDICSPIDKDGDPLYYDKSHLSIPGSWKLGFTIIKESGVPHPFTLISDWPPLNSFE